jgi:hypothetical protein
VTVIMLRGHEFYVRTEGRTAEAERVRAAVGAATDVREDSSSSYCVVLWDEFQPPEQLFEALSGNPSAEVVWLAWQKQVDAFCFQRWLSGKAVRRLAYGVLEAERTWEFVDGVPEPCPTGTTAPCRASIPRPECVSGG